MACGAQMLVSSADNRPFAEPEPAHVHVKGPGPVQCSNEWRT